jgi:type IV pilus assembly protein PilC
MANYNYEGIDPRGKKVSGNMPASNAKEVRKALFFQRVTVTKVYLPLSEIDIDKYLARIGIVPKFDQKVLLNFTKQLAVMLSAGIPIMQALDISHKSEKNPAMKKAILGISISVGEGKTVAEAMLLHNGFDKTYCSLVKAGEAGGMLDSILSKLANHMEKQQKIKSQIKGALMYPSIVVIVGVAVVWGMMVFMIPVFVGMLKENNTEIPAITQFVMNLSAFAVSYTIYIIPLLVVAISSFMSYIKTPAGKYFWDSITMRLPVFGMIIIKGNLAGFSSTLGTLLTAGVSLLDGLEICIETTDNGVIANDLRKVRKKILEGQTLGEPLGKISYFPGIVTQMIKVGEQTGQIDEMLTKVAKVFEDDLDELIGGMTKLIEPFIIIVLGGTIGGMLVAMYLPMFKAAG